MSTLIRGTELREIALGRGPVSKASGTLDESTTPSLFTIAGGEVLITAMWAVVTTAITVANTVTIQANPTTGDSAAIVAGDVGTTDTAAGTVLGTDDNAAFVRNGAPARAVVSTGTVELDSNGTSVDGALTVYCCWVPLTDGATLEAAS